MQFLSASVPIFLLFAVIMTNGEIDQLSATDKPSEAKDSVAESLPDKTATDGPVIAAVVVVLPMEISSCEKVCDTTLNCSEWNHCAFHHPDNCLGLQEVCSDDDLTIIANNADDYDCIRLLAFRLYEFLWIILLGACFYVYYLHFERFMDAKLKNDIQKTKESQKTANCIQNFEQTQEQQKEKSVTVIPVESDSLPIVINI